jgi:hypothetical protein
VCVDEPCRIVADGELDPTREVAGLEAPVLDDLPLSDRADDHRRRVDDVNVARDLRDVLPIDVERPVLEEVGRVESAREDQPSSEAADRARDPLGVHDQAEKVALLRVELLGRRQRVVIGGVTVERGPALEDDP